VGTRQEGRERAGWLAAALGRQGQGPL
jgi:hypothetical protein